MADEDKRLESTRRPGARPAARRSADEQAGMLRSLYERAQLTWKLLWDRRVGLLPKIIPALGLVYILSPVDLLPEVLVGALGPLIVLDDLGVIMLVLNLFIQASPPDVVSEHLREMRGRRFQRFETGDDEDVVDSVAEEVDD